MLFYDFIFVNLSLVDFVYGFGYGYNGYVNVNVFDNGMNMVYGFFFFLLLYLVYYDGGYGGGYFMVLLENIFFYLELVFNFDFFFGFNLK